MTKNLFRLSPVGFAHSLRQGLLLGSGLTALLAAAGPAAAQIYVGNNFTPGSSSVLDP